MLKKIYHMVIWGKNPVLNSTNIHEISKKCYSKLENIVSTFWRAKIGRMKVFECCANFKSRGWGPP